MDTYGYIYTLMNTSTIQISPEILTFIAGIDEFKGAWKALGQIAPKQLLSLKRVATIESIGSSTRIEGSKLTDHEVELLLKNIQVGKFASRDEEEVAGYAELINTIFLHYDTIPLTENYIKQFHRDLLRFSEKDRWHRGEYKKSSNHVEAFDASGKSLGIVFETASPFETPYRMQTLVEWVNETIAAKALHPLLVTAVFVVELLAIHPFQDGNGRLSRILTTYLLLKCGYAYVPYSSLEAVIENSKEGCYLALRQTQGTFNTDSPNWQPWILFFLQALTQQTQRLETKLDKEKLLLAKLPALSQSIMELTKLKGRITNSEVTTLTGANRNTVKKHLEILVANKALVKHGVGKGTWYSIG